YPGRHTGTLNGFSFAPALELFRRQPPAEVHFAVEFLGIPANSGTTCIGVWRTDASGPSHGLWLLRVPACLAGDQSPLGNQRLARRWDPVARGVPAGCELRPPGRRRTLLRRGH